MKSATTEAAARLATGGSSSLQFSMKFCVFKPSEDKVFDSLCGPPSWTWLRAPHLCSSCT